MIPKIWRISKNIYKYQLSKCEVCGKKDFPYTKYCVCGGKNKKINSKLKGKIVSFTLIHRPHKYFLHLKPYYYGIIELDEGVRIPGFILSNKKLEIGMRVFGVFRKICEIEGVNLYGYKFFTE